MVCRSVFLNLVALGLIWMGNRPVGAAYPARIRLTDLRADTQLLLWNESGEYQLTLPEGWTYPGSAESPVQLVLAGGKRCWLWDGSWVRVTYRVPVTLRAAALDVRVGPQLHLTGVTRSLEFPPETLLEVQNAVSGVPDQEQEEPAEPEVLEVVRLEFREPREIVLEINEALERTCDRCEVRALPGANNVTAGKAVVETLSSSDPTELEEVAQLSLWSARRLRVTLQRGGKTWNLEVETGDLQWSRVNGQPLRPLAVVLDAPRVHLKVRRWFPWSAVRQGFRAEIREASGQMAEDVTLTMVHAPKWLRFSQVDSPAYLREQLRTYGQERADRVGTATDLPVLLEEYLLPLWFGIWYDLETNAEVVRADPALPQFRARLRQEETRTAAQLQRCFQRWGKNVPGAAAEEQLRESLDELIAAVRAEEDRESRGHTEVWGSLYLGDLLSASSGGAYHYWYPRRELVGRTRPRARPATLGRLRAYVGQGGRSLLRQHLDAAQKSAAPTDELHFSRLLPEERRTLQVWLDVPPHAAPGRYEAGLRVGTPPFVAPTKGENAEAPAPPPSLEQEVPITFEIQPDYLTQSGTLLLQLLPALLVILGGVAGLLGMEGKRRRRQAQLDHWGGILQEHYAEFLAFQHERPDLFGTGPLPSSAASRRMRSEAPHPDFSPEAAQTALEDFLARGLHETLPPRLFAEFTALCGPGSRRHSTTWAGKVREFFRDRVGGYVQQPQRFV